ncbi:molecular chaperone, partial [Linderina pennispora]
MAQHAATAAARETLSKKRKTCWNCQQESDPASVFCSNNKCGAIQPVGPTTTYFDVLVGGRRTFDVDMGELRRVFLKLQQGVHPDSYSQKEDIERTLAETQSSWINRGYATLRDPLHRAHYLLKLAGRKINEEDKITDPELLMEVMELREEIEMAQSEEQMAAIKRRNDSSIEH